jgi:uncharacterized membrane protein YidH (DUF202 family)
MQQIQALLNRPRLYYNIDGAGEIAIGIMLLGFLSLFWMQIHSSLHSFWNQPYGSLYILLICLALHFGVKAFKQTVTYPRTGFVRYKATPIWYLLASALVAAATVLFIAAAGRHLLNAPNVLGVFFALFLAVCYGYGIARVRAVPWKWLVAGAIALSGTIVALLPATVLQPFIAGPSVANDFGVKLLVALFPYFLVWSPLFLLSGSITLILYLRTTHVPAPDGQ